MRALAVMAMGAVLAGCAAKVVSTGERTVVVHARIQDVADAQKLADAECAKFKRKARLSGKATMNQFVYDCEL